MLCRLMLQGWNSALQPKITCSGFGILRPFVLYWRMHLFDIVNQARRSTETLWPSHQFWLPLHLWTLRLWAALKGCWLAESQVASYSPCLQFKLGPKTFFQFFPPEGPRVSSRTFPPELLLELELVEFQHMYLKHIYVIWLLCSSPPTHALSAKWVVINATLCTVDIFN